MSAVKHQVVTWLVAAALLGPGCGKKRSDRPADAAPQATEPAPPECETDDDCPGSKVCFLDKCVDNRNQADLLRQRGSVTPDQVQREVDKRTEQYQKQLDRGLDMDE